MKENFNYVGYFFCLVTTMSCALTKLHKFMLENSQAVGALGGSTFKS